VVVPQGASPPLELVKCVQTHWGSMYDLIDQALTNGAVCQLNVLSQVVF